MKLKKEIKVHYCKLHSQECEHNPGELLLLINLNVTVKGGNCLVSSQITGMFCL